MSGRDAGTRYRLKHFVIHGSVTAGGNLSNFSGVSGVVGLASREVVGHLGVQLFNSLLFWACITATTALSASTGLSTSASSTSGGLFCGSGLGLVLLWLAVYTC